MLGFAIAQPNLQLVQLTVDSGQLIVILLSKVALISKGPVYIAFLILVRYIEIGAEAVRRFIGVHIEGEEPYILIFFYIPAHYLSHSINRSILGFVVSAHQQFSQKTEAK